MAKNRADSAHVQTEIVKNVMKDFKPPECVALSEKHMPFWEAIVAVRHTWTDIDLFHAANLARTLCSIEEETSLLEMEGTKIENHRGTPVMNPRFAALQQLTSRATTLSQKLQVHAQATMGNPRDQKKKNKVKMDAIEAFHEEDDDLIARPVN